MNPAPADLREEGVSFDLPIALGLLAAAGSLKADRLGGFLVAGELALDGGIHPVRGVLPMALAAGRAELGGCLLVPGNARAAAVVDSVRVYPVASLAEAAAFLAGERPVEAVRVDPGELLRAPRVDEVDFADVRGQAHAKRSRSRRRGATTSSCSGRRGPERRCWRGDCPRSFRRSPWRRRWR